MNPSITLSQWVFCLSSLPMLLFSAQSQEIKSMDSLSQTARQCRQEVDQLWSQQHHIPQEQRRDFHIAIGIASQKCDDLKEALTYLQQATTLKQAYEQAMDEAQALSQNSNLFF